MIDHLKFYINTPKKFKEKKFVEKKLLQRYAI